MSFVCVICSDSYTGNGTEHSIFSTKCGHLFGKSCLEKWARENNNQGKFKCPVCCEPVRDSDYHQIYDLPKELLKIKFDDGEDVCCNEDDILKRCLLGTLDKESTFFIEIDDRELSREFITFFDVHNGFILVAGNHEYLCAETDSFKYFLRIYKGLEIFYDRVFGSVPFTTVTFNKFREDVVEFCVGFENGSLQSVVLTSNNGICGTPHERVLFNEDSKINSVCFLEKNNVVYSVGECNIFSVSTDIAFDKENWLGNVNVELTAVTNLAVMNNCVLFGIMDGKVYVFEKNKIPYVLYCEEETLVTNYTYDSVINMISIVNSLEFEGDEESDEKVASHVLRIISKVSKYDNAGYRRDIYISSPFQDLQDSIYELPQQFKSTLILMKDYEKCFIYSFIPNIENGMLQVHFVNDNFNVVNEKEIEGLDECIGVLELEKPKLLLSKVLKIPLVIIFNNRLTTLNYYTVI
uniref:RING-type domain-containing protein n=1 Tax=Strongyloides venezuelensis TaxID=75913 RepID=A0A0K0FVX5_STRVS